MRLEVGQLPTAEGSPPGAVVEDDGVAARELGRHVQRAADCHTRSGSAFTYTAFFPNDAVEIKGETRSSRTMRAAERWADCRG